MKRLLAISLLACSTFAIAEEDALTITLAKEDIAAYKALDAVNKICGTSIEADQLTNPNDKISFNFQDIPCDTAINLFVKFDNKAS